VLDGDGVRLRTAGRAPAIVQASDEALHAFPGDDATDCELLGGPTRDLNVMRRRLDATVTIRSLRSAVELCSQAQGLGCFAGDAVELATGPGSLHALQRHALAWLDNPARATLNWRVTAPAPRGWWIEVCRSGADDDQAD
jgi:hypothetical protein